MKQSTEKERAEFTDGAWYWVEKEGWHDEPPKIAPAMYRADCDAWYSWEFSGISTEYLKVLEPCVRHEQAARRAQVVPLPKNAITASVMIDDGGERPVYCLMAAYLSEGDALGALSMLAAAPQPPEAEIQPKVCKTEIQTIGCNDHIEQHLETVAAPETAHATVQAAVHANLGTYHRVMAKRAVTTGATDCWCQSCDIAASSIGLRTRMSVCPQCGDKRCARALHHDSVCISPKKS